MRRLLLIPAVLLILIGLVFTLQGVNVLKGSSLMSGRPQWAAIGIVLILVGLVVGWFGLGRRRTRTAL
ncbi:MAG: hypothetical protein J2P38_09800 [Candidatus Dormibacteraeota bacterium]|nr:hypothetical protein [Candidatus Dormibacteraeota bacterium]